MKLKKLRNGTVLITIEKQEKTTSGVFIPDTTNAREVASIIQVADDVEEYNVGDRVLFKTWAPNIYKIDSDEFAILNTEHIDGVL